MLGALSDATKEREQGVGDAPQDRDDEGRARVALDPRMVVFLESSVEDLVGGFDAPVAPADEQPILQGKARLGQAGDEVAVSAGPLRGAWALEAVRPKR